MQTPNNARTLAYCSAVSLKFNPSGTVNFCDQRLWPRRDSQAISSICPLRCNGPLFSPPLEESFLKLSSSWRETIMIGPLIACRGPSTDLRCRRPTREIDIGRIDPDALQISDAAPQGQHRPLRQRFEGCLPGPNGRTGTGILAPLC